MYISDAVISTKMFMDNFPAPWTILLTLTIYLLYKYLTRHHNYWKSRNVPHEEPLFLAGNLWDVFKGKTQIGKHLGHLYSKFDNEPYFGIYIVGKPYLVIRDPELVKRITIKDFNNFSDRTFACDQNADRMAGNSLFILRNPVWRNLRSKLTPIFTSGKLKVMVNITKRCAERMQIHLEKCHNQTLDVREVSAQYMTDLVASCFFGIEANSFEDGAESGFRKASREMFETKISTAISLFSYFFLPKLVSLFKMKMMDTSYFENVFSSAIKERQLKDIKRNDFVDLMLQLRENLHEESNAEISVPDWMVSQAITFFIAGFETTSNAVAFTLYELCLRQDCQDKLRQEIQNNIEWESEINLETLQKMKYLDMVLSETLRRYPFGPFLNRNCHEDYLIPETGLVIKKGTPVLIPIDGIHNDPEYYPEPEKFIPERFDDGNRQNLTQKCVYLPFGSGPRSCIGDRFALICAKIGLIYFLKKFKVERCESTPQPLVLNAKSPFMTPVKGLKMIIKKVE